MVAPFASTRPPTVLAEEVAVAAAATAEVEVEVDTLVVAADTEVRVAAAVDTSRVAETVST
jgi:hypothetical protein